MAGNDVDQLRALCSQQGGDIRRCNGIGDLEQDGAVSRRADGELCHANGTSSTPRDLTSPAIRTAS